MANPMTSEQAEKNLKIAQVAGLINVTVMVVQAILFRIFWVKDDLTLIVNLILAAFVCLGTYLLYKRKRAGLVLLMLPIMILIIFNLFSGANGGSLLMFVFLYIYTLGASGFNTLYPPKTPSSLS